MKVDLSFKFPETDYRWNAFSRLVDRMITLVNLKVLNDTFSLIDDFGLKFPREDLKGQQGVWKVTIDREFDFGIVPKDQEISRGDIIKVGAKSFYILKGWDVDPTNHNLKQLKFTTEFLKLVNTASYWIIDKLISNWSYGIVEKPSFERLSTNRDIIRWIRLQPWGNECVLPKHCHQTLWQSITHDVAVPL